MPWARLDDAFWRNPKVLEAGNEAAGVYARALSYSADNGTLGHLNASTIKALCGSRSAKVTRQLCDAELWELDPEVPGGIIIHDYDDPIYGNPTVTSSNARSEKARNAARARWDKRNSDANEHATGNANGHAPSNAKPMLGYASRAQAGASQSQSQAVSSNSLDGPLQLTDARTEKLDHRESEDEPPTAEAVEHLAITTQRLRPDWTLRRIRTAIADAVAKSGSIHRTTPAMLVVALTADSESPRRVIEDGFWWQETDSRHVAALLDPRLTEVLDLDTG